MSDVAEKVLTLLNGGRAKVPVIVKRSGGVLTVAEVSAALANLERRGIVGQHKGTWYDLRGLDPASSHYQKIAKEARERALRAEIPPLPPRTVDFPSSDKLKRMVDRWHRPKS